MADQNNPQRPYNWNGSEGAFISKEEANNGFEAYKASPAHAANGGCNSHYIGGKKLMQLLSEEKAVGVRAYYTKSQVDDPIRHVKKGDAELYFVPVDSAGNNIFTDSNGNSLLLNNSWPCPFWCPKED